MSLKKNYLSGVLYGLLFLKSLGKRKYAIEPHEPGFETKSFFTLFITRGPRLES